MVTRLSGRYDRLSAGLAGGLFRGRPDRDRQAVFLDLKLHDIGNTVAKRSGAWRSSAPPTVHAYPQTMKAAVEGKRARSCASGGDRATSYDDADLAAAGDLSVGESPPRAQRRR